MGRKKKFIKDLNERWRKSRELSSSSSHSDQPNDSTRDSSRQEQEEEEEVVCARNGDDVDSGTESNAITTLARREALIEEVSKARKDLRDNGSSSGNGSNVVVVSIEQIIRCFDAAQPTCAKCSALFELEVQVDSAETKFVVKCKKCDNVAYKDDKKKADEDGARHTLSGNNEILVYYSLEHCLGYTGYCDLVTYLKLQPVSEGKFDEIQKQVEEKVRNKYVAKNEMLRKCVLSHYRKLGFDCDEGGALNVDVTFDSTWVTSGSSSHTGIVAVIECETGFVLDFEVLSNFCLACTQLENSLKVGKLTMAAFRERRKAHRRECHLGLEGKSGGMEAKGGVTLWRRSLEKLNMRYVTFVCDGDSSAYSAVSGMNGGEGPYEEVDVEKVECINHISRRLGRRLRSLKAKERKVAEAGRNGSSSSSRSSIILSSMNKLSDGAIDLLCHHYNEAVRRCIGKTVEAFRKDLFSTFDHCSSTDNNPRHYACPLGTDSWCFYNRAIAERKPPPSHKTITRLILDSAESRKVRRVYMSLTNDDLLQRCLRARTQNPSKSFHSKVLSCLFKTHTYGIETVRFSTTLTVLHHNFGHEGTELFSQDGAVNSYTLRQLRLKDGKILDAPHRKGKKRKLGDAEESSCGSGEF